MERAKKDCILLEAAKCFARFGFKKTSVDEIAKQAGVAKGTVYLAAESKEDLYYQVLNREVRRWIAESSRVIDRRPADVILAELLWVATEHLDENPLLKDLLLGAVFDLLPTWKSQLEELRELGRGNIVELLKLGVKQRIFREDLDIPVVAALLQDFHLAGYVLRSGEADTSSFRRRALAGLDLVLHGLKAHPPPLPA
jgi:AcrR family transcriptional regulator